MSTTPARSAPIEGEVQQIVDVDGLLDRFHLRANQLERLAGLHDATARLAAAHAGALLPPARTPWAELAEGHAEFAQTCRGESAHWRDAASAVLATIGRLHGRKR